MTVQPLNRFARQLVSVRTDDGRIGKPTGLSHSVSSPQAVSPVPASIPSAVDIDAILRLPMPKQIEIVRSIGLSIAGDEYATSADRLNGQAIADCADDIERDHFHALRGDPRDARRAIDVADSPMMIGASA